MIEREVAIRNRLGLHARAAAKFVQTASRFQSDIKIRKNGEEVDGKSIGGATEMNPLVPSETPSYWLVYFSVNDVD